MLPQRRDLIGRRIHDDQMAIVSVKVLVRSHEAIAKRVPESANRQAIDDQDS